MAADVTVTARHDAAKRAAAERTLATLVRKQGILLLVLGVLWGLVTLRPVVAASIVGQASVSLFLAIAAMLVVPLAMGALGVRQLRRRPHIPEIAVAITPTSVQFPAIERPSGLFPRVRGEEWAREGTIAEIRPASGLLRTALVVFARQDGRKRRRRTVSAENLAIDPRILVDALEGRPSA